MNAALQLWMLHVCGFLKYDSRTKILSDASVNAAKLRIKELRCLQRLCALVCVSMWFGYKNMWPYRPKWVASIFGHSTECNDFYICRLKNMDFRFPSKLGASGIFLFENINFNVQMWFFFLNLKQSWLPAFWKKIQNTRSFSSYV